MKKKRKLLLLIVSVLMFALLVGCGNKSDQGSSNANESTSADAGRLPWNAW